MFPTDASRSADSRARAAQTKRDRTRRALLDAAGATFASKPWADTRMEDIAAAAGVSPATAYNHFASKHTLIGHVYAPLVQPLLAQAEKDLAAQRSTVQALEEQIRALCRLCFRHRTLSAALWSAVQEYTIKVVSQNPDHVDDDDPRSLAPLPAGLRMLLEHGQRTGELRAFPPAREISSTIANLLLLWSAIRPVEPPEATAEVLLTVVFGALRPELLTGPHVGERPFRRPR